LPSRLQVYKAVLRDSGAEVAVKVQRPFVLETVSLDLYLARQLGFLLRRTPLSSRLDVVELIDEFAPNFYAELDYNLECQNGERITRDMARLPMVVIPKNYPALTTRRVHVAEWVYGEKLSQVAKCSRGRGRQGSRNGESAPPTSPSWPL
jgi:aarF domain-containing kinase